MKVRKKMRIWAAVYALLLGIFTVYVLLDAFVIARSFVVLGETPTHETVAPVVQPTIEADQTPSVALTTTPAPTAAATPVISDMSYEDESIAITLSTYREHDTTIYVAEVVLSDISHLITAFANNTYGRNVTEQPSAIAQEHDAILAINGDYYGAQRSGYVLRNGVLYRDSYGSAEQEVLCIWPDGSFTTAIAGNVTADELLEAGALQVFSFGPALVRDGEVSVVAGEEVGKAMANNPRTAIAMIEPLHYLFVVADGRTAESTGLSLHELAEFMYGLGAQEAYNLDGGGSSTMVFQGRVVNYPTTRGERYSERAVSDIVYVK